jgi:hypothetical protein
MYDNQIGRWMKVDGKAELYFGTSPYVYALDQPTNAVDPDGNLVIFINGNHFGDGGTPQYWRQYQRVQTGEIYSTSPTTGITVSSPIYNYKETYAFDKSMMNALHDHNENWGKTSLDAYKDGGLGGWGMATNIVLRYAAGYSEGASDAATVISNLARDKNGNITESIKIVAHSMGAAYAKGYIAALMAYAKKHPEQCQGLSINEYDIGAYQPGQQQKIKGTTLNQFYNTGDNVNKWYLGSSNDEEDGADTYKKSPNDNGGHSIFDFKWIMGLISSLPAGTYVWDSQQQTFVPAPAPAPAPAPSPTPTPH